MKNKKWFLGFLGFLGLQGAAFFTSGRWQDAMWFLFFTYFLYFIPEKKQE